MYAYVIMHVTWLWLNQRSDTSKVHYFFIKPSTSEKMWVGVRKPLNMKMKAKIELKERQARKLPTTHLSEEIAFEIFVVTLILSYSHNFRFSFDWSIVTSKTFSFTVCKKNEKTRISKRAGFSVTIRFLPTVISVHKWSCTLCGSQRYYLDNYNPNGQI